MSRPGQMNPSKVYLRGRAEGRIKTPRRAERIQATAGLQALIKNTHRVPRDGVVFIETRLQLHCPRLRKKRVDDQQQVGDDIMNRWRSSVDELAARRRQQGECERAQEALSRVTSCFQQLASSLGSSADCSFLRDEMDETRALANRICRGLSQRLLRLLSDWDSVPSGVEDRQVSERLWVLFLSALESFLHNLRKASDLIGQFPLNRQYDRRSLVNSGCVDGMVGLAARVASVQVPWLVLEEEPSPDLTNHIAGLEAMLSEMQLRVPVAFWSVEATQAPWTEAHGEQLEPDHSLEDLMEVEVVSSNKIFQAPCCGLGCVG